MVIFEGNTIEYLELGYLTYREAFLNKAAVKSESIFGLCDSICQVCVCVCVAGVLFSPKCGAQLVCVSTGCLAHSLALPMWARVCGCCCPTPQDLHPSAQPPNYTLLLTKHAHTLTLFSCSITDTTYCLPPTGVNLSTVTRCQKNKVYRVTAVSCRCVTLFVRFTEGKTI